MYTNPFLALSPDDVKRFVNWSPDFCIVTDARQAESASALNSVRSQTAELSARQRALEQSLEAQLMEQRGSMRTTHSSLQSAHPELKAVIAKQNGQTTRLYHALKPGPGFSKHLKSVFVVICWARKIEIVVYSWKITAKHLKFDTLNLDCFSVRRTKYLTVRYTFECLI